MLLSCSTGKSISNINKDFTIISAERSTWFGGREGVKGAKYEIVLKNNQKKSYHFTNFKIGKSSYPVRVSTKNNTVIISALVTHEVILPQVDVETGRQVEKPIDDKDTGAASLEYILSDSKTIYSLNLQNIKEKNTPIKGEALPN